jgi:hypothetical protein
MGRITGWLVAGSTAALATLAHGQGTALLSQKISETEGNFSGMLDDGDHFGHALAGLGDLDGDGSRDLLVGAPDDDDGGTNRGALWLLFLDDVGLVQRQAKLSTFAGGFTGALSDQDRFGSAVAELGDLDGDGVGEIAVGAEQDDDGGSNRGAVWILFLDRTGAVRAHQKISATEGGFAGPLLDGDRFGSALAGLGDLDGDRIADLAVGAKQDDDGGANCGAVWILGLERDGTVKGSAKISAAQSPLAGLLSADDRFGCALARVPDLDLDGVPELAVGADQDDDVSSASGAAYVLFLDPLGGVKGFSKICGGLALGGFDRFGSSVASLGDLDGDGVGELAVGAIGDDDGGLNLGAVWVLFLGVDGQPRTWQKLSAIAGGFSGPLSTNDNFGIALAALGDQDGDGIPDLAIGSENDDDGSLDAGATWVELLDGALLANPVVRNGQGINRVLLGAEKPPVIGSTWKVEIDCSGHEPSYVFYFGAGEPLATGIVTARGEWLVDFAAPRLFQRLVPHLGGPTSVRSFVPADLTLIGRSFYSQAVVLGRPGFELTNALDGWATP